jgi:hypothetical protein
MNTAERQLFPRQQFLALAAVALRKAKKEVVGTTADPTTSSGSFVVIPEMTMSLATNGGDVLVHFSSSFKIQAADAFDFTIYVDGAEVGGKKHIESATLIAAVVGATQILVTGLSIASHTIEARWRQTAGNARAVGAMRSLTAIEV